MYVYFMTNFQILHLPTPEVHYTTWKIVKTTPHHLVLTRRHPEKCSIYPTPPFKLPITTTQKSAKYTPHPLFYWKVLPTKELNLTSFLSRMALTILTTKSVNSLAQPDFTTLYTQKIFEIPQLKNPPFQHWYKETIQVTKLCMLCMEC